MQVHRIQNKKLWKQFAFHYSNMQERWSHEPTLNLVNGGLPQLWHGTCATEPQRVYATEQGRVDSWPMRQLGICKLVLQSHMLLVMAQSPLLCLFAARCETLVYHTPCPHSALPAGFTFNFASMKGIWGAGTYYSSKPSLAMKYHHRLRWGDTASSNRNDLAGLSHRSDQDSIFSQLRLGVANSFSTASYMKVQML